MLFLMNHRFFILLSSVLVLLFFVSCKDRYEYRVGEPFVEYLQRFESEAATRGKKIDLQSTGVIVEFADLKDNQAGLCHYEKPIRIEIDREYWDTISTKLGADLMKENLLFHELGHGILDRKHINTTLPNGDWKSIMCGGDKVDNRSWNINYRAERRQYYIDELFNESTPTPSFASLDLPIDTNTFNTKLMFSFDSPSKSDSGWEMVDSDGYTMSIDQKRLKIQSKISSSYIFMGQTGIDVLEDFTYEIRMECIANNTSDQFGIVFGNSNPQSIEYLCINANQKMYMGNRNFFSFFTELSKNEIKSSGINRIRVVNRASKLYYFINDVYVYCSESELNNSGNSFGFLIPPNAVAWLDDMKIGVDSPNGLISKIKSINDIEFKVETINTMYNTILNQ